jgi:hypothetical protein
LWISIKKQLTHYDENIILGSIYLPPENSRFFTAENFEIFEDEITKKCQENKYVYLAGDTNSRVGTLRDFIRSDQHINHIFDIDDELQSQLDKYTILENLSISLNRNSADKRTNTHGLRLIDICKNNNIFILNGRMFQDQHVGNFTFRDSSVIDYVIATAECYKFIKWFEIIETDSLFSDGHNAISWKIDIQDNPKIETKNNQHSHKRKWKHEKETNFINNINVEEIQSLCDQMNTYPQSRETIEYITKALSDIFTNSSDLTFPEIHKSLSFNTNTSNKPWFGPKCHEARRNYHEAKNDYISNKNIDSKTRLRNASKQ